MQLSEQKYIFFQQLLRIHMRKEVHMNLQTFAFLNIAGFFQYNSSLKTTMA